MLTASKGDYKSLQNDFYYVNDATIDTFGIEKKFLKPVLRLADLSPKKFEQIATPSQWLFFCKEKEADIRGKGALRYIEAMADRAATQKKQTGKKLTIRQALTAQSGGLWYAPKAKPSEHHVWIRKGFGGVFAPFIFENAATVDQRCNSVSPVDGVSWEELAALLTSTLFAYSAEVNGSISMGAGVLEAPTKKIRDYPIFDVRRLAATQRGELIVLARSVWAHEQPVDWSAVAPAIGPKLKALDQWLLKAAGNIVPLDQLYADLQTTVKGRVNLATDKVKSTKTKRTENIGSVAAAIVARLSPRMRSKNFPDDFIDRQLLDLPFLISHELVRRIKLTPFIDQSEIVIESENGKVLLRGQYDRAIGEGIVRAILWGRSSFSIASDKSAMHKAIDEFLEWLATFEKEIEQAIGDSAFGTGYEAILKQEVYAQLGLSPFVLLGALPQEISVAPRAV